MVMPMDRPAGAQTYQAPFTRTAQGITTEAGVDPNGIYIEDGSIDPRAPSQSYIAAMRSSLEARDRLRNDLINTLISMRFQTPETDPQIPEAFEKTSTKARTSVLGDSVDRVVSALTIDPWRTRIENVNTNADRDKRDGNVERYCNRFMDVMDRMENRDVRRMVIDQTAATGHAILKFSHKHDWWLKYPTAENTFGKAPEQLDDRDFDHLDDLQQAYGRNSPPPFRWTDLDYRTYHEVPGPDGNPSEVLIISRVEKFPTMMRYNLGMTKKGNLVPMRDVAYGRVDQESIVWAPRDAYTYAYDPYRLPAGVGDTSELVEHWCMDPPDQDTGEVYGGWYSYEVDGRRVRSGRHFYPRPPFFEFKGISTSSRDPRYDALSVIFHMASMTHLLDTLLTIQSNAAFFTGFPTFQEKMDPQLIQALTEAGIRLPQRGNEEVFHPGYMLHPVGEIRQVGEASVSANLMAMVEQIQMYMDKVGISGALKGNMGGDPSGYLANQLITASLLSFHPITSNASFTMAAVFNFMFKVVQRMVGTTLWLGESRIKPDDAKKYGLHNIFVDIKPRVPQNDIALGTFGNSGVQLGTISMRTNRQRFWQIDDPEAEQMQIDIETAMKLPEVKQAQVDIAMYDPEFGLRDMMKRAALLKMQFQQEIMMEAQNQLPQPPTGGAATPEGAATEEQAPEGGGGEPTQMPPNNAPGTPSMPGINAETSPSPAGKLNRGGTGMAAQGGGMAQKQPDRGYPLPNPGR